MADAPAPISADAVFEEVLAVAVRTCGNYYNAEDAGDGRLSEWQRDFLIEQTRSAWRSFNAHEKPNLSPFRKHFRSYTMQIVFAAAVLTSPREIAYWTTGSRNAEKEGNGIASLLRRVVRARNPQQRTTPVCVSETLSDADADGYRHVLHVSISLDAMPGTGTISVVASKHVDKQLIPLSDAASAILVDPDVPRYKEWCDEMQSLEEPPALEEGALVVI